MSSTLLKNVRLITEGFTLAGDLLIRDGIIERIEGTIDAPVDREIPLEGKFVMPGIIDDQVHFRDPGLTHKADIYTESRAAVAGGVTSFMEMPNTKPPALTQELLEQKYDRARQVSLANYSFYMGASNDNLEEVLRTDPHSVCGIKVFMGSSTGNMLVDDEGTLEQLFSRAPLLIATHCEDEATIRRNLEKYQQQYGEDIPIKLHPEIRSVEGCLKSSTLAVELARKYSTRLHVLHLSTKNELILFDQELPRQDKRITSEVCVHHLYFNDTDYDDLGTAIKCNPAIKDVEHQRALLPALLNGQIDLIATDHAPHTWDEKQAKYLQAPSGIPLVQHSFNVMLEFFQQGRITLEQIVDKMCHAPADCFQMDRRGYLREGYWADLVVFDPNEAWTVSKENVLYKCGWSPFEGHTFRGKVYGTFVNGHPAYWNGRFNEERMGQRLAFKR